MIIPMLPLGWKCVGWKCGTPGTLYFEPETEKESHTHPPARHTARLRKRNKRSHAPRRYPAPSSRAHSL